VLPALTRRHPPPAVFRYRVPCPIPHCSLLVPARDRNRVNALELLFFKPTSSFMVELDEMRDFLGPNKRRWDRFEIDSIGKVDLLRADECRWLSLCRRVHGTKEEQSLLAHFADYRTGSTG
jgi:hypothetical protein